MKTSFRVNFTFSSKGVKNFIKSVQSGFMLVRTASISTVNEKRKKTTKKINKKNGCTSFNVINTLVCDLLKFHECVKDSFHPFIQNYDFSHQYLGLVITRRKAKLYKVR